MRLSIKKLALHTFGSARPSRSGVLCSRTRSVVAGRPAAVWLASAFKRSLSVLSPVLPWRRIASRGRTPRRSTSWATALAVEGRSVTFLASGCSPHCHHDHHGRQDAIARQTLCRGLYYGGRARPTTPGLHHSTSNVLVCLLHRLNTHTNGQSTNPRAARARILSMSARVSPASSSPYSSEDCTPAFQSRAWCWRRTALLAWIVRRSIVAQSLQY